MLTANKIKKLLEYNPKTGLFRWKKPRGYQATGWFKGNKSVRSYRRLWICEHHYLAHRVAWVLMTGKWPDQEIDHKDHNQSNNKWSNLRQVTHGQNAMNRRLSKNSSTGVHGVSIFENRFRAQIRLNGHQMHIGLFDSIAGATRARKRAAKQYFGEFAPDV